MGDLDRLSARPARTVRGALALVLVALLLGAGCREEAPPAVQEQRRELLTPPDQEQRKIEQRAERQVLDADGVPIPSDQVIAGFPIPRSFELYRNFEHEWYLRSRAVSAEALARYVEQRVFTGTLERTGLGGYRFVASQLRSDQNAPKLTFRISPTKGWDAASELYIEQLVAPERPADLPSDSEVQAQMEARRKHAD